MKLIDFLIPLLTAQAETLVAIDELLGERVILEVLEHIGEWADEHPIEIPYTKFSFRENDFYDGDPYGDIDAAVQGLRLKKVLEFHLWGYPLYRYFVEGPWLIQYEIRTEELLELLISTAVTDQKEWLKRFNLPEPFAKEAIKMTEGAWIKFQVAARKKFGKPALRRVIQ